MSTYAQTLRSKVDLPLGVIWRLAVLVPLLWVCYAIQQQNLALERQLKQDRIEYAR